MVDINALEALARAQFPTLYRDCRRWDCTDASLSLVINKQLRVVYLLSDVDGLDRLAELTYASVLKHIEQLKGQADKQKPLGYLAQSSRSDVA